MFTQNRKSAVVSLALVAVLIAGSFGVQPARAETMGFGWVQGGNGLPDIDYGRALALDESGNVYDTGFVTNGPGNQDIFIRKWSASGNPIWSNGLAGLSSDMSSAITLDSNGNVYVTGSYSSMVEFDPGNPAANLTSAGFTDAFLIKYDAGGNFLWVKSVGGASMDRGSNVAVDDNGNVYVVGYYSDTVDFDPGEGTSSSTSAGTRDVFLSKFDSNGSFLWVKSVGGAFDDEGFGIAIDGSGNIFMSGFFSETVDFDPGPGTSNLTSAGEFDLFISKLDSSGNFAWAQSLGGYSSDNAVEIVLDGSGNAYVAGYFNGGFYAGTTELISAGYYDILITKLDSSGNFIWAKGIGGPGYDFAYGIAMDDNEDLYLTGEFSDTVDFDPGTGTSNLISAGLGDIFISKLDSDGNFVWAESLGGIAGDGGDGIAVDGSDGNLYLAGFFSDTVDFDPGAGISNLTSGGDFDPFILKLTLTPHTPQILYVRQGATGLGDGTSWENAYTDLQPALGIAAPGDEIWVAAGMYMPTSEADRAATFLLENGVAIYGGFDGTETSREQRDPAAHVTILSGDIGNNDSQRPIITNLTTATGNTDNSYHVVTGATGAILDGFTITAGYANSDFPNNSGAGMYNSSAAPTLTNVTFSGNFATGLGGGVYNTSSSPHLMKVTFNNNSAALGGGLLNELDSSPTLENVTFSGNSATEYGGGMLNRAVNSNPVLTNVTFSNNSATIEGGAIANAGHTIIRNSILWGNTGGEIVNLPEAVSDVTYSIVQGGYADTGNLDVDPLLGSLQDNGGFTQTMALGPGSPAVDAGDDENCPDTDQRDVARPQGNHCDIGAHESQVWVVTSTTYSGAGSLLQAIADAVDGDTIRFDPSLAGQTIGLTYNLVIDKDLMIDGSGLSPQVTVSGQNLGHLEVPYEATVTISDLILTNGNYGIMLRGDLTIINSTLKNNVDYSGGAISNFNGSLTLLNSTVTQNLSHYHGGAIFVGGTGTARIVNSTITQNQAVHNGGAIYMQENAAVEIINSTFAGNSAQAANEILMTGSGSLTVTNSLFACAPESTSCYDYPAGSLTSTNSILGTGILADFGLSPLADRGGPTQTMALLPGSPAIDAGDNENCPDTDQRGMTRPQDGNNDGSAICDIGAFESEPDTTPPTVSSIAGVGADHTSAASVDFLVTFSEPVKDVDTDDFALEVGGGLIDTGITNVAGFGPTRTVTVNTGFENGTLGLSVALGASINDLAGNLIDDLPFSSGTVYVIEKPFTLIAPANGEALLHKRPAFDWTNVEGASGYRITASTSSSFSTVLWKADATESEYTPTADLPGGRVIYWRVRAMVDGVWGAWSGASNFTTPKPPSIPVLTSPTHGALTRDYTPLLNWSNSTLPTEIPFDHYQVQVDIEKSFADPLVLNEATSTGDITASSYTPNTDLIPNSRYYWRVRSYNTAGQYSSWSTVWAFNTALPPPIHLAPTGGVTVTSRRPALGWDVVEGVDGYIIQISTSASFATTLVNTTTTTNAFTPLTKLPAGTTIYWRVRATGTNGPSRWSIPASFHTP